MTGMSTYNAEPHRRAVTRSPTDRCDRGGPALSRTDWALALLRLAVGGVFVAHGVQKVVVWGAAGGVPFFREAGIPAPELAAPLVAGIETLGGAALVVGLLARPAALLLGIVMLVAALAVHLPHGFFLPMGMEFVLTLACTCAAIAIAGPGRLSLDARWFPDRSAA